MVRSEKPRCLVYHSTSSTMYRTLTIVSDIPASPCKTQPLSVASHQINVGLQCNFRRLRGTPALELCTSAAKTIATSAANVRTALAACEYSHCRRATSNDWGRTVQKPVAALTG